MDYLISKTAVEPTCIAVPGHYTASAFGAFWKVDNARGMGRALLNRGQKISANSAFGAPGRVIYPRLCRESSPCVHAALSGTRNAYSDLLYEVIELHASPLRNPEGALLSCPLLLTSGLCLSRDVYINRINNDNGKSHATFEKSSLGRAMLGGLQQRFKGTKRGSKDGIAGNYKEQHERHFVKFGFYTNEKSNNEKRQQRRKYALLSLFFQLLVVSSSQNPIFSTFWRNWPGIVEGAFQLDAGGGAGGGKDFTRGFAGGGGDHGSGANQEKLYNKHLWIFFLCLSVCLVAVVAYIKGVRPPTSFSSPSFGSFLDCMLWLSLLCSSFGFLAWMVVTTASMLHSLAVTSRNVFLGHSTLQISSLNGQWWNPSVVQGMGAGLLLVLSVVSLVQYWRQSQYSKQSRFQHRFLGEIKKSWRRVSRNIGSGANAGVLKERMSNERAIQRKFLAKKRIKR